MDEHLRRGDEGGEDVGVVAPSRAVRGDGETERLLRLRLAPQS